VKTKKGENVTLLLMKKCQL